jgi:spore germination protein YaaH
MLVTDLRTLANMISKYLSHPAAIAVAVVLGAALGLALIVRGGAAEVTPPAAEAEAQPAPTDSAELPAPQLDPQSAARVPDGGTELIAFWGNFDELGFASLDRNAQHIDVLMPMWYHLGSDGVLTFDASQAARVRKIIEAKNPGMRVMPIVNNYDKASEAWNAPQVAAMIADPARRVQIAEHIVATISAAGYQGLNIDFESFTEADRANLVAFMAELYPRAKAAGLEVSMDVIVMSKTYDHAALAQHVDYLVPMMYDEHWKTSPAGPISSIPWFDTTLARFLKQVPAEKVMVGMGTYSYDWGDPSIRAKSLTFATAVEAARANGAPIALGEPALNSSFSYSDGTFTHSVWMLDAMSAFNQLSVASKHGVRGFAIWRLGAEDPALWNVLPRRDALDRAVAETLGSDKRTLVYDDAKRLITSGQTSY